MSPCVIHVLLLVVDSFLCRRGATENTERPTGRVCGGQLPDKSPCHSALAFITNQTVGQMYFQPPDIVRLQNSGGLRRNAVESLRGQRGELPK